MHKLTILELQKRMDKHELTSHELVSYYIDRIKTIDPNYHAVYMINPEALHIANRMDEERKQHQVRSHMHGIPVLIKDNINTKDKQTTTAGTTILKDHVALEDASMVKRLREQGAVILGKTNLTELACFKTFTGVNGYSSLGGQVIYPWATKEDPSGSSTGSAVAVSIGLSSVAIGTETGGSIMSPSMRNGIVGLKPTIGLVSRKGIIPISFTLDTAGPMARNVTDLAMLLSSMRSNDFDDVVTLNKKNEFIDYTTYLHTNEVKRIGIVKHNPYNESDEDTYLFQETCKHLKKLGYELIDIEMTEMKHIYDIMKYEFKYAINQYLKEENLDLKLKDIIEHNKRYPEQNLKYGQEILLEAQEKTSGKMDEETYISAMNERDAIKKEIEQLFDKENIDMIYVNGYTSNGPACGFPTMTIPVGFNKEKLPVGCYFLAPYYQEGKLLEVAYKLEQALNLNMQP